MYPECCGQPFPWHLQAVLDDIDRALGAIDTSELLADWAIVEEAAAARTRRRLRNVEIVGSSPIRRIYFLPDRLQRISFLRNIVHLSHILGIHI